MAVAARFYVAKVERFLVTQADVGRTVTLNPVLRATDDNVQWSKYTPSGEIRLTVTAQPAGEWFEDRLGKDIAITFEDPTET
jgi:hypothetical protein